MRALLFLVAALGSIALLGVAPEVSGELEAPAVLHVADAPLPAVTAPEPPAPAARPSREADALDGLRPEPVTAEPPRRPLLDFLLLPASRARSRPLSARRAHTPRGPPLRVS